MPNISSISNQYSEFEQSQAMRKLISELEKGFESGDKDGWLFEEDLDRHFAIKHQEMIKNYSK